MGEEWGELSKVEKHCCNSLAHAQLFYRTELPCMVLQSKIIIALIKVNMWLVACQEHKKTDVSVKALVGEVRTQLMKHQGIPRLICLT